MFFCSYTFHPHFSLKKGVIFLLPCQKSNSGQIRPTCHILTLTHFRDAYCAPSKSKSFENNRICRYISNAHSIQNMTITVTPIWYLHGVIKKWGLIHAISIYQNDVFFSESFSTSAFILAYRSSILLEHHFFPNFGRHQFIPFYKMASFFWNTLGASTFILAYFSNIF